jgi:Cdc6-like AAA superfamily ATPase
MFLKIHSNPFLIDQGKLYQTSHCKLQGCQDELDQCVGELIEFVTNPEEPRMIEVRGEAGSGKTLLARAIIKEMLKEKYTSQYPDWSNRESLYFLAGSPNCSSEKKFLNGWR